MSKKTWIIILGILLLGSSCFLFFTDTFEASQQEELSISEPDPFVGEGRDGVVSEAGDALQRYTHLQKGFTFLYPDTFTVGGFFVEDSEVILVQDKSADRRGFQVYVTDVDPAEVRALTPAVIQAELPEVRVLNPKKVVLDGAPGIMFESNNEGFDGESFEIWFEKDAVLYQVSSYASFASELQNIIGTWQFN